MPMFKEALILPFLSEEYRRRILRSWSSIFSLITLTTSGRSLKVLSRARLIFAHPPSAVEVTRLLKCLILLVQKLQCFWLFPLARYSLSAYWNRLSLCSAMRGGSAISSSALAWLYSASIAAWQTLCHNSIQAWHGFFLQKYLLARA